MFGGLCLITLFIEFPYRIYQGVEFSLSAQTIGFYLIFSFLFGIYRVYSSKKIIGSSIKSI
jgi:hypothetical protein